MRRRRASSIEPEDSSPPGCLFRGLLESTSPAVGEDQRKAFLAMLTDLRDDIENDELSAIAKRRLSAEEAAAAEIVMLGVGYAVENTGGETAAKTVQLGVILAMRLDEYVATMRAAE